MARPHAAVSTTGAFVYQSTDHRQYIRRDLHPRNHFGRVACCCYTTDAQRTSTPHGTRTRLDGLRGHRPHPKSNEAQRTSGSGGNRTHVNLLKRQAPSQRRTHFHSRSARSTGSGPHGSRTRTLPLDRRPLYRLSFWTVFPIEQVAEESNPAGLSRRFWRPSAFPDAVTTYSAVTNSTPCGSRTRPKRLERPPTSPEVERGLSSRHSPGKSEPAGGRFLPPAGAVAITGSPGVIRSYPVPRFPYPDPNRDPSQADP
jgi:hypothetical protein